MDLMQQLGAVRRPGTTGGLEVVEVRRERLALASALAAALLLAGPVARAGGPAPPPPYRLAALRAFLFHNDSGTFSPNIPPSAPLWNTVIGEGWAKEPS